MFIEEEPSCGPFGDFFGGMLNPTLTFLMFMGLLSTINLQQKELSLTRKEYIRTADALEEARLEAKKQTAILTESCKKNRHLQLIKRYKERARFTFIYRSKP